MVLPETEAAVAVATLERSWDRLDEETAFRPRDLMVRIWMNSWSNRILEEMSIMNFCCFQLKAREFKSNFDFGATWEVTNLINKLFPACMYVQDV